MPKAIDREYLVSALKGFNEKVLGRVYAKIPWNKSVLDKLGESGDGMLTFSGGKIGLKGDRGDDGTPAGFGAPVATIDAGTGTPSVAVAASGPDAAKIFSFAFSNLKGAKGDRGEKGEAGVSVSKIEQTATSAADSGENVITVTLSDGTTGTFSVRNGSRGNTGPTGEAGQQGEKGDTGEAGARGNRWHTGTAITGTATAGTVFSGSGIADALADDMYMNTSTFGIYRCTTPGAANAAKWAYIGSIKAEAGAKGDKGDTGATGANGAAGTRGSMIYWGTSVTGTSATATVFPGSGVASALTNDLYVNTSNWNVYQCTTAGAASVAKWAYRGSIKGAKGDKGDVGSISCADIGAAAEGHSHGDMLRVTFSASEPTSVASGEVVMVYEV